MALGVTPVVYCVNMDKKTGIKSHKLLYENSVLIELTDGTQIEVVAQPEGEKYDLHVMVKSDRQLSVDFTLRGKAIESGK